METIDKKQADILNKTLGIKLSADHQKDLNFTLARYKVYASITKNMRSETYGVLSDLGSGLIN